MGRSVPSIRSRTGASPVPTKTQPTESQEDEDEKPGQPEISPFLAELCQALEGERQGMIEKYVQDLLASLLAFNPPDVPELHQGFFDMGMESVIAEQFRASLEESFLVDIADTAVFDYPNISELSEYIVKHIPFSEIEKLDKLLLATVGTGTSPLTPTPSDVAVGAGLAPARKTVAHANRTGNNASVDHFGQVQGSAPTGASPTSTFSDDGVGSNGISPVPTDPAHDLASAKQFLNELVILATDDTKEVQAMSLKDVVDELSTLLNELE
jgi:acyl carrier protein